MSQHALHTDEQHQLKRVFQCLCMCCAGGRFCGLISAFLMAMNGGDKKESPQAAVARHTRHVARPSCMCDAHATIQMQLVTCQGGWSECHNIPYIICVVPALCQCMLRAP